MAVKVKMMAASVPRRFSCGRHRRGGSAATVRPATPAASARRAGAEALAMSTSSATSHSCACKGASAYCQLRKHALPCTAGPWSMQSHLLDCGVHAVEKGPGAGHVRAAQQPEGYESTRLPCMALVSWQATVRLLPVRHAGDAQDGCEHPRLDGLLCGLAGLALSHSMLGTQCCWKGSKNILFP